MVDAECGKSRRWDDKQSGGSSTSISEDGPCGAGGGGLVELAEKMQGRTNELDQELDSVREALAMAR